LPPIGKAIDYLIIAFLAIASDMDKAEFRLVTDTALTLTKQRRIGCALLGLAVDSPLLEKLHGYQAQTYRTCIESVNWRDRDSVDSPFTKRIVQPEIALL
jgi:hypothetical protein